MRHHELHRGRAAHEHPVAGTQAHGGQPGRRPWRCAPRARRPAPRPRRRRPGRGPRAPRPNAGPSPGAASPRPAGPRARSVQPWAAQASASGRPARIGRDGRAATTADRPGPRTSGPRRGGGPVGPAVGSPPCAPPPGPLPATRPRGSTPPLPRPAPPASVHLGRRGVGRRALDLVPVAGRDRSARRLAHARRDRPGGHRPLPARADRHRPAGLPGRGRLAAAAGRGARWRCPSSASAGSRWWPRGRPWTAARPWTRCASSSPTPASATSPPRRSATSLRQDGDVVVVAEPGPLSRHLAGSYPTPTTAFEPSGRGEVTVVSRFPMHRADQRETFQAAGVFRFVVDGPGGSFVLYAAHPDPPGFGASALSPIEQERLFGRLQAAIAAEDLPVVLAGDLNLVDRSAPFRRLTDHLVDATGRHWRRPTSLRWRPLLARIDHVLVSPGWCRRGGHDVPDHRVGPPGRRRRRRRVPVGRPGRGIGARCEPSPASAAASWCSSTTPSACGATRPGLPARGQRGGRPGGPGRRLGRAGHAWASQEGGASAAAATPRSWPATGSSGRHPGPAVLRQLPADPDAPQRPGPGGACRLGGRGVGQAALALPAARAAPAGGVAPRTTRSAASPSSCWPARRGGSSPATPTASSRWTWPSPTTPTASRCATSWASPTAPCSGTSATRSATTTGLAWSAPARSATPGARCSATSARTTRPRWPPTTPTRRRRAGSTPT